MAEDLLKDSFAVMSDHEPRFSWLDHNHSSSAAVKFVDADDSEYEVSRFFYICTCPFNGLVRDYPGELVPER